MSQVWRNWRIYLRKMSEFGAIGAFTCGKCRNLAQVWRIYLRKMSEFGTSLAQLLAEIVAFWRQTCGNWRH